ncbi:MAG: indolepyruvate ferredoxin oxidoreductase family protein [Pseudomonadota bacterium]
MTTVAPDQVGRYAPATENPEREYLSGVAALAKLPEVQQQRDAAAGLTTAAFVSGYRGSPLGGLDQALWARGDALAERNVVFQPGVNEDMAATAIWGSQQIGFFDQPKFDGVFGLWYGKGPGVDRSGDALRHANLWGTHPSGGVVMAVGDDPMSRSSSIQQQSEQVLAGLCIPVFNAASVQDVYDYSLIGWSLSRFAGVWVAVKMVSDIAEAWMPVDTEPGRTEIQLPEDFAFPPDGPGIRWPDNSVAQDERMLTLRLPAVRAFTYRNRLNRAAMTSAKRRFGIVTAGKSYLDTREALKQLGIDGRQRDELGLSVFKAGLIWPLEEESLLEYARGLDELLVVEESRAFLEPQVKSALYNLPESERPRVVGKQALDGGELLRANGELTPALIARALSRWLGERHDTPAMREYLQALTHSEQAVAQNDVGVQRSPYFCSGCPHNTSTRIPEGSTQLAGIGCHFMVTMMDRDAVSYSQMGGEGATWVGAAPFVEEPHVFVNLGDGTYYHSGSMAIRQAIAAGVNATYKILFNDAVAMTGGQPVDGPISVAQITHELHGEGAARIVVVSNAPQQHDTRRFAAGVTVHHRDELGRLQRELREQQGVSVIIYEQTCATELRRRRKRKLAEDPKKRVYINDRVCEGCGDCSVQSNCLSVQPLETEFGRKRVIDQSACNKDYSCLNGFCPSFVTVEGGELAPAAATGGGDDWLAGLPEPGVRQAATTHETLVAGIGGTGVVTISNILAAAAKLEGKSSQVLELTGLAQKFGAVYCHLKIVADDADLTSTRLSVGGASLLIGADIVTAGGSEALINFRRGKTNAVVNSHATVTGQFTRERDFEVPVDRLEAAISDACGERQAHFFDSTRVAEQLTGNTIGANIMLVGFAAQQGFLPVSLNSIEQAIADNGVAVDYNIRAFRLGRLMAHDPDRVRALASSAGDMAASLVLSGDVDEVIRRRTAELEKYQNAAYARRYSERLESVREAVAAVDDDAAELLNAIARNYFKLLAYKDEYEVARLYTDGEFVKSIKRQFAGDYRLRFHLAPDFLARRDAVTGKVKKVEFGAWILPAMRVLAKLKFLRGTRFDVFGKSAERRAERQWISRYEAVLDTLPADLDADNYGRYLRLLRVPDDIRGYGYIKQASMAEADETWTALFAELSAARTDRAA